MIPIRWPVVWLVSCLLVTVLGAPVNDPAASGANATSSSDFDAAIAEIRAKRETLRKKSAPARLYPGKFAAMAHDDDTGGSEQDDGSDGAEEDEAIANLLAVIDRPAELNALAKEIALDFLMAESAREAHRSPAHLAKKKKSRLALDDERRKRANALFYRLMDEELENNDDADDDSQEERDGEIVPDSDGSDEDNLEQTVARALANQGLSRREIEAVFAQLDDDVGDDDDDDKRKKKKRSGEWRKFPRAGLRWRFLHSLDADDHAPFQFDDDNDDDEAEADDAEERRFFGRGFHRLGPGVRDEISRGVAGAGDKRMLRPLKTRRTYAGVIKKRSVSANAASGDKPAESSPDVRAKTDGRKKRSVGSESAAPLSDDNKNDTSPPRALPLAANAPENHSKDEPHNALIRKKSVDWDDYFGFDKRKRAARKEDNEDDGDDEVVKDYLENEYYKAIAGSLAYRRKRGSAPADHVGHGMMKKSNSTARGAEQRKLDQLRAQMVAHLISDLDADDLDEMADRLSRDLVQVMRGDDDDHHHHHDDHDHDDDDFDDGDDTFNKRRSVMQPYRKRMPLKKRKSLQENGNDEKRKRLSFTDADDDDEDDDKRRKRFRVDDDKRRKRPSEIDEDEKKRRKRFPVKRAPSARRGRKESDSDDGECVIAEQVVATCDMVSHLYGGYRPVLSDACFRHQACAICSDNEDACNAEYQRRVMALCGPDLLCQSQSRHLLTALNQLDEMEVGFSQASQHQIEALCRRDACLADLFKRR